MYCRAHASRPKFIPIFHKYLIVVLNDPLPSLPTASLSVLLQGGGKRKGSIAVYLEPWHADIVAFLDLKKNHGNELERARDLFYAMWIPDLFMQVGNSWALALCDVESLNDVTAGCPRRCFV